MESARIVITGLGAVSPLGLSAADMWSGLCAATSGIGTITSFDPAKFPCKLAGEVTEYKIRDYVPKSLRKSTKLMSKNIELAVIAAAEALGDSGLVTKGIDPDNVSVDPTRMAINLGAGLISCDVEEIAPAVAHSVTDGVFDIHKWGKEGLELVTPLWLLKYLPNMLACHIGIIHDIQGPSNTITSAESSALVAIAEAAEVIERGDSDIALAGGAEAKVHPIILLRQILLRRATTENNDEPQRACRPFDADAKGSVFGDGAGIVVLESLQNARNRDARIYAEIAGTAQSISINPQYERLEPDGRGVQIAVAKALCDAQIEPDELDLIIPHGTGIPQDDLAEAKGIEAALGQAVTDVPVWPTKSMLSTTGAACGGLDVVAAICAMRDGVIPAAKNCDNRIGGCNLNIVTESQKKDISYVLCFSYTYGGQTAAVVLKGVE